MSVLDKPLLAFHGDPAIKEFYLARVRAHRAADDIVRGTYGSPKGSKSGWRGCAVGCSVHSGDHSAYEREMGIPVAIAWMEDRLFERMPIEYAIDWPVEFLEVIPVGADLSLVIPKLLLRGIQDVRQYADDATLPVINRVIEEVLEPRARGEAVPVDVVDAAARAAWAAYVAAADAAAWAADAAADAAAGAASRASRAADAADAAAREAKAYEWSRWLLELLRDAPVPEAAEGAL